MGCKIAAAGLWEDVALSEMVKVEEPEGVRNSGGGVTQGTQHLRERSRG